MAVCHFFAVKTLPMVDITVRGLSFCYDVPVVGTSGSGESTLLHIMGGLDTPTSGSVIVWGQELAKMNDEELVAADNEDWEGVEDFLKLLTDHANDLSLNTIQEAIAAKDATIKEAVFIGTRE